MVRINISLFSTKAIYLDVNQIQLGEYSVDKLHMNAFYNKTRYGNLVRESLGKVNIVHIFDERDIATVVQNESKYPERRSHRGLLEYRKRRPELYSSGGLFPE